MKGIVLAGGAGSRLYPLTSVITKQLQPIYDKPMIYYPISLLMICGIKEIAIITTPHDQEHFKKILGNGERFGVKFEYIIQKKPEGIAQAYLLTEEFLAGEDSIMILGDNLFHGNFECFRRAIKNHKKEFNSYVFAYQVADPERYGVVEFEKESGKVLSIEEKPTAPKSNYAIPGLYIMDSSAPQRVREMKPSERGELEITDLIKTYLSDGHLGVEVINRGMAWLDTGTPQSFLEASAYIAAIEQRQGLKVACLEEVALRLGFISSADLEELINETPNSSYRDYLKVILKENKD
jgi:glucose-1-phosphate thymidylyltransferase